MALYFVCLTDIADACFHREPKLPPQTLIMNRQNGEQEWSHFSFHSECPYKEEDQSDIVTAANFLVYRVLKAILIPISAGHFILSEEEQNIPRVKSACSLPLIHAQNETQRPLVYSCKITVPGICYDLVKNFIYDLQCSQKLHVLHANKVLYT